MSNPWIELDPPHHLDISVIVHDQGIVASKLQQVLAPSVDRKIIKEGKICLKTFLETCLAQPLPLTCQPGCQGSELIRTNMQNHLSRPCEADQLDSLVVCHLHTHVSATLGFICC